MATKIEGIDNRTIIGQLFKAAFGVTPMYLPMPIGEKNTQNMEGYEPEMSNKYPSAFDDDRVSVYSTPIVAPVFFKGNDYRVYDDKGRIITRKYEDLWLPATTMVDFSRAKNIIKTNVLGGNGTVKEIYGFDDWVIRIRMVCLNEEKAAREYENLIVSWSEIIEPIEVKCALFTRKQIHRLVIEDMDIRSIVGQPDVVPIELSCVSDEAIELFNQEK